MGGAGRQAAGGIAAEGPVERYGPVAAIGDASHFGPAGESGAPPGPSRSGEAAMARPPS